jgi:hypothetical protein
MRDAVNIVKLVRELAQRPRGRACIVLTHDYGDQKDWAAELAHQTNNEQINLLDLFTQDSELAAQVSSFSVHSLFDFLKNYRNSPVLIVSGWEFLKAAWAAQPNALHEFASRVERWQQSPALLLLIQFDPMLATIKFTRFPHLTFVVDQKETLALT